MEESRKTILIAEDTDSNYLLISAILKKEYKLVRAYTGVEAISLYKEIAPDIILMDVKMPEMDGMQATQEIRKTDTKIPIIAVTAFAFDGDRQRLIAAGCNDYVSKPISAPLLREKLHEYLG